MDQISLLWFSFSLLDVSSSLNICLQHINYNPTTSLQRLWSCLPSFPSFPSFTCVFYWWFGFNYLSPCTRSRYVSSPFQEQVIFVEYRDAMDLWCRRYVLESPMKQWTCDAVHIPTVVNSCMVLLGILMIVTVWIVWIVWIWNRIARYVIAVYLNYWSWVIMDVPWTYDAEFTQIGATL